jgi:hypothetical protein
VNQKLLDEPEILLRINLKDSGVTGFCFVKNSEANDNQEILISYYNGSIILYELDVHNKN